MQSDLSSNENMYTLFARTHHGQRFLIFKPSASYQIETLGLDPRLVSMGSFVHAGDEMCHFNRAQASKLKSFTPKDVNYFPGLESFMLPCSQSSQPRDKEKEPKIIFLTKREGDIISLLALGLKNEKIGSVLNLTHNTIKAYNAQLFIKLGIKDRLDAALMLMPSYISTPYSEATLNMPISLEIKKVLLKLLEGGSDKEMGQSLGKNTGTITAYLSKVFGKIGESERLPDVSPRFHLYLLVKELTRREALECSARRANSYMQYKAKLDACMVSSR